MELEYLNPEKFITSRSVIGHKFLGLTVDVFDSFFVFTYPYENVKDSSCLVGEKETPRQQVVRFIGLLELLIFTPYYNQYRLFISEYCRLFSITCPFIPDVEFKIEEELCREGRSEQNDV